MKHLFANAEKLQLKNRTVIRPEGSICYVSSGFVALDADFQDSQLTLRLFKKGEIVDDFFVQGKTGLPAGITLTLRTHTNVILLCMPKHDFQKAIFDSPQAGAKYVTYLQQQNLRLTSRLVALSYKDVYRRLVARLLFLAEWFGTAGHDSATIGFPLTHRQLALSVSSTRETVNKLMRRMSNQGLVISENRLITVPSLKKLRAELRVGQEGK
jgi:CRP/FNR family transcriptional regulator